MRHSEIVPAKEIYRAVGISPARAELIRREEWARAADMAALDLLETLKDLREMGIVHLHNYERARAVWYWAVNAISPDHSIWRVDGHRWAVGRRHLLWRTRA